jgi:hypothetical protein
LLLLLFFFFFSLFFFYFLLATIIIIYEQQRNRNGPGVSGHLQTSQRPATTDTGQRTGGNARRQRMRLYLRRSDFAENAHSRSSTRRR